MHHPLSHARRRPTPIPKLHNYTTTTATPLLLALTNLQLARGSTASGSATATGRVARHLLVVASDLADDVVEGVVDVDAGLGGCLDEFAAEGTG